MTPNEKLVAAIASLEATQSKSVRLAHEDFASTRAEQVRIRVEILKLISMIGSLGNEGFTAGAQREQFRSRYEQWRAVVMAHHGAWPIVTIDLQNPAFVISLAKLRLATADFINWVKAPA